MKACEPAAQNWLCAPLPLVDLQCFECVNASHSCKYEQPLSGWTESQMGFSQSPLFSMSPTRISDRATCHRMAGQGQYRRKHFCLLAQLLLFVSLRTCLHWLITSQAQLLASKVILSREEPWNNNTKGAFRLTGFSKGNILLLFISLASLLLLK